MFDHFRSGVQEGEGISRYVEAGPKSAFNSRCAVGVDY